MQKAWHLHPPQSISFLSQDLQGSGIQSVPLNLLNDLECSQIHDRGLSFILSNSRKVKDSAAWQGNTFPAGVIFKNCLPQPPIQDLGFFA